MEELDRIVEEELVDTSGSNEDDVSAEDGGDSNSPVAYDSRATVRFTVKPNEKPTSVESVDMRLTKTPVGLYTMMMKEKVGSVQQTISKFHRFMMLVTSLSCAHFLRFVDHERYLQLGVHHVGSGYPRYTMHRQRYLPVPHAAGGLGRREWADPCSSVRRSC